ncbi:MAG: PfkB family carbohydrate kinase [Parvibaculaceae bacterium]
MTALKKLAETLKSRLKPDDTLVFVYGNFNILHPGHVRLLQFAKSNGTFLLVGITPDGTPGTSIEAEMRLESIRAIGIVDLAFVLGEPVLDVIETLKPKIVTKGKEHEARDNPELAVLESYGGRLLFNSGEMRFTDLSVIDRQYSTAALESAFRLDPAFLRRHDYASSDVLALLQRLKGLRVAVVGDLIIDEYVDCEPLGMSQEDPTLVVSPISSRMFVGGSGIVAAHCAGLGAEVSYITVAHEGPLWDFAVGKLKSYGVKPDLLSDRSRPTTLKKRYRAHNKTLLRVSDLRQYAIEQKLQDQIYERVEALAPHIDALLFSDFNYGCLPTELVTRIAALCAKHEVRLAADSQASSQYSDVSRFRGMDIITPTEREARLAVKDSNSGLVELAEKLRLAADAKTVLVTLGAEGLLIHAPSYDVLRTDRLPAMNPRPQDVAGAGDSLFSSVTLGLCAGGDIWLSSYLASAAAACQVSKLGNTPLSIAEIAEVLS